MNNLNEENNNFILHSNDIINNLLINSPKNYKGEYRIGNFVLKINELNDINKKHLNNKQYHLLLKLDDFKFE